MSEPSADDATYRPAIEAIALLAVTLPLALLLRTPALWALTPAAVLYFTDRPLDSYGLTSRGSGTLSFHLVTAMLVFAPYCVGHWLFASWVSGAQFEARLPQGFGEQVLDQFLVVALSEEVFFRGYLQAQLDQAFGRPWRVLGANVGLGWIVASLLFAACHIFNGGPVRLIVFFPGLLYGWLRARTGNVLVPIAYHAVSNLLMSFMLASFAPSGG